VKKIKRGDFLLLLGTCFVAIFLLSLTWGAGLVNSTTHAGEPLIAKVERDGKTVAEINLNSIEDTQYLTFDDGIKVTIEAKQGKIRFYNSQCPDKICVKTGWLTKDGHIAVCMPARTVVTTNLK